MKGCKRRISDNHIFELCLYEWFEKLKVIEPFLPLTPNTTIRLSKGLALYDILFAAKFILGFGIRSTFAVKSFHPFFNIKVSFKTH
jgi:hypothetical protein